jgi:hypothetical protein
MKRNLRWRSTCLATAVSLVALLLLVAGCSRPPAADLLAELPPPDDFYIDWDELDWHIDRYLQVNMRDFVIAQNLGRHDPAADYRAAVTYRAVWDSVGLDLFRRLNDDEQADRRRLAARHHAEARRLVLSVIGHHGNLLARGYLPNLNTADMASRPQGVETVVTRAISHWIRATGLDPSHPAAWRDLAYFCGVVGDRKRQQRALGAALAALDHADPSQARAGASGRLRRDLFLDLAWLARDQGQPELSLAYLDHLQPWLAVASPEREDRHFEAQVLSGLVLAEAGRQRAAAGQASQLPAAVLLQRTQRGGVREDLRWHLSAPLGENLGYMRANWPRQDSDFARRWIRAWIGAPSGEPSHTIRLLGAPPTNLELPPRLAGRYWQDRGQLHARAGDLYTANRCFEWAAFYRPYMAFFPLRGTAGPSRLGPADSWNEFYTGYGVFFLCGDRSAYLQQVTMLAFNDRP